MRYKLLEGQTANVLTEFLGVAPGNYTLSTGGAIGAATVTLKFKDADGLLQEDSPDFTFSGTRPAPFVFKVPEAWQVAAEVAGADGATNISLSIQQDFKR
jgi:hypothetical protein